LSASPGFGAPATGEGGEVSTGVLASASPVGAGAGEGGGGGGAVVVTVVVGGVVSTLTVVAGVPSAPEVSVELAGAPVCGCWSGSWVESVVTSVTGGAGTDGAFGAVAAGVVGGTSAGAGVVVAVSGAVAVAGEVTTLTSFAFPPGCPARRPWAGGARSRGAAAA
jgi:hypothetical protein